MSNPSHDSFENQQKDNSSDEEPEVQLVESEADFFSASSASSKLYFLHSRYIFFDEGSFGTQLDLNGISRGFTVHLQQRMNEAHTEQRLDDNTGSSVYDASVLLARHLFRTVPPARYDGTRILELGAGPGLPAVVASLLAGSNGHVVATDGNDMITRLSAHNFEMLAAAWPAIAVPKAVRLVSSLSAYLRFDCIGDIA